MATEVREKHLHILQKAEDLFAKKGFEATTVRDIAKAAGINLAMISYYFGSKDRLLEQLFRYRMSVITEELSRLTHTKTLSPLEKLQIFIEEYINRVFRKQSFYKIIFSEQIINNNPKVIKLMQELKMNNFRLIEMIIKDGQNQKLFKEEVDILFLLNTVTGTVIQNVISKEYYKQLHGYKKMPGSEFDDLFKQNLRIYLNNLLKAILMYEK